MKSKDYRKKARVPRTRDNTVLALTLLVLGVCAGPTACGGASEHDAPSPDSGGRLEGMNLPGGSGGFTHVDGGNIGGHTGAVDGRGNVVGFHAVDGGSRLDGQIHHDDGGDGWDEHGDGAISDGWHGDGWQGDGWDEHGDGAISDGWHEDGRDEHGDGSHEDGRDEHGDGAISDGWHADGSNG